MNKPTLEFHPRQQQEPTIELDGKSFVLSELPKDIQELTHIYGAWRQELFETQQKHQLELLRIEAAIQGLGHEIRLRIQKLTAPAENQQPK